jgi:hypothetical protein
MSVQYAFVPINGDVKTGPDQPFSHIMQEPYHINCRRYARWGADRLPRARKLRDSPIREGKLITQDLQERIQPYRCAVRWANGTTQKRLPGGQIASLQPLTISSCLLEICACSIVRMKRGPSEENDSLDLWTKIIDASTGTRFLARTFRAVEGKGSVHRWVGSRPWSKGMSTG